MTTERECMERIFKLFIVSLLMVCLIVATVICCCFAPAVMAHFHKISACSHCQAQNSSHCKSSNSAGACQYHLTSAEFSHSQAISLSVVSVIVSIAFVSFNKHLIVFLPSSPLVYPPGGPPLIVSSVPIYISTHSLRI